MSAFVIAREHFAGERASFATSTENLISLDDLKRHLRIPVAETHFDQLITDLANSAYVMIETQCGRDIVPRPYTAEYCATCDYDRVRIDRADVISIESVSELDYDGTSTALETAAWEKLVVNKITDVRRKDNNTWAGFGSQTSAIVKYTRGIGPDADEAYLVKALIRACVKSSYESGGQLIEDKLRVDPAYMRAVDQLKDRRSSVKQIW